MQNLVVLMAASLMAQILLMYEMEQECLNNQATLDTFQALLKRYGSLKSNMENLDEQKQRVLGMIKEVSHDYSRRDWLLSHD